jgi:hypothetical protein
MSTYVFAYRAPKNYTPSSESVAAWTAWFDSLGDNLVDRGNPVFDRSTVGIAPAETVLGGYSLIAADDVEAAVTFAKGCPIVQFGGGVEVGELTILNNGTRPVAEIGES